MLSIKNFSNLYYTHEDLLAEIKAHKGSINEIIYPEKYGTFLYKAVFHDYPTVVKYLLENGADPNVSNCLNIALKNHTYDIAEMLLEHGAKVFDTTYFTRSLYDREFKLAELMIKQNTSIVQDHSVMHELAYFYYSYNLSLLQFLVEHGAYINNRTRDIIYSNFVYDYQKNTSDNDYDFDSDYSDSDSDYSDSDPEEFYDYRCVCINYGYKDSIEYICKKLAQRRWTFVKCYCLLLGLHQRAVISANHPNRLKQLGVFNVKE